MQSSGACQSNVPLEPRSEQVLQFDNPDTHEMLDVNKLSPHLPIPGLKYETSHLIGLTSRTSASSGGLWWRY